MAGILTTNEEILEVIKAVQTIAVIGAKGEGGGPANRVPGYLIDHGYEIFPIHPREDEILGRQVVRSLGEVTHNVDLVLIFRKSEAVPGHLEEILLLKPRPRAVWMQLGIQNAAVAEALVEAGIDVVQDHCMMVEHRNLIG